MARIVGFALAMLAIPLALAEERLPVTAYAQLPNLQHVQLSPNGQRVAGVLNAGSNSLLVTRALAGDKLVTLYRTDNRQFAIAWFRWVDDDRLLVSLHFPERYKDGIATTTRLISVRYDGTGAFNLFHRSRPSAWVSQLQDDVIDWKTGEPGHVLVAADLDRPLLLEVYDVDVNDGKYTKVSVPTHVGTLRWLTDRQHRVRVTVRQDRKHVEVLFCDPAQKQWQVGWSFDAGSEQEIAPIGFGRNPDVLYVSAYHEGRRAIFTADLSVPDQPLQLKYAHARYDVDELVYSERVADYIGIVNPDGLNTYEFWNPEYRELAAAVDKAFPQTFNRLVGFSADDSFYVLFASGNGRPGIYYVGSQLTGKAYLIGETYPQLPPEKLAGKQIVQYKSRDGVEIQGYLTLPKSGPRRQLPAIVFPHGGPVASDGTDFDYWTEFFASRGYAVLQMDFRGSSGYGYEFMQAGLRDGGWRLLDDITDGAHWLVDSGIADRQRICIVGASYGGYAALMAAAREGDLYRCAVSFAGVSDRADMLREELRFVAGHAMRDEIARQLTDRDWLVAASPLRQVAHIGIPILLVHGTFDQTVPFRQSEVMAQALQEAGKRYEFIPLQGGDHHLSNYDHRLQLFEAMDRFLQQNLAPAADAAATDAATAKTATKVSL